MHKMHTLDFSTLDDLDFADNLTQLSHTHRHINKRQTDCSSSDSKWSYESAPENKNNVESRVPIKVNRADLSQIDKFTCLGTIIRHWFGTEEDIRSILGKAGMYLKALTMSRDLLSAAPTPEVIP